MKPINMFSSQNFSQRDIQVSHKKFIVRHSFGKNCCCIWSGNRSENLYFKFNPFVHAEKVSKKFSHFTFIKQRLDVVTIAYFLEYIGLSRLIFGLLYRMSTDPYHNFPLKTNRVLYSYKWWIFFLNWNFKTTRNYDHLSRLDKISI